MFDIQRQRVFPFVDSYDKTWSSYDPINDAVFIVLWFRSLTLAVLASNSLKKTCQAQIVNIDVKISPKYFNSETEVKNYIVV